MPGQHCRPSRCAASPRTRGWLSPEACSWLCEAKTGTATTLLPMPCPGAPRQRCPAEVIGVTGSVGKTTTKEMIASVLSQRFCVLKSERNLNNEIGLPLTVLQLDETHQKAVLEMGMYDLGEIRMLCEIPRPTVGVVTNVGP